MKLCDRILETSEMSIADVLAAIQSALPKDYEAETIKVSNAPFTVDLKGNEAVEVSVTVTAGSKSKGNLTKQPVLGYIDSQLNIFVGLPHDFKIGRFKKAKGKKPADVISLMKKAATEWKATKTKSSKDTAYNQWRSNS